MRHPLEASHLPPPGVTAWRDRLERLRLASTAWVPDSALLGLRYYKRFGRWPSYRRPSDFNEWTHHHMLTARDAPMARVADKFEVRDYVAQTIGPELLTPLLGTWTDVEAVPLERLPRPYVLKDCLGSLRSIFVREGDRLDPPRVRAVMRYWRDVPFWRLSREWAYSQGPFRVMAETLLDDGSGWLPADYKVYTIGGKAEFVQVDRDRFRRHTRNLYSTAWEPLPVRMNRPQHAPDPRPAVLERMLETAERLARPFVFLRVDFYIIRDRLFVGELTNYSGAGFERFEPEHFALRLGDRWQAAARQRMG